MYIGQRLAALIGGRAAGWELIDANLEGAYAARRDNGETFIRWREKDYIPSPEPLRARIAYWLNNLFP